MDYAGTIIEESLKDPSVMKTLHITKTKVEPVTEQHKTPWLKQWTLHSVIIPEAKAQSTAGLLSQALDDNYWYADFKNNEIHYVIFPDKVFKVELKDPDQYKPVVSYGLSLNIPRYQLDFSPAITQWERPTEK